MVSRKAFKLCDLIKKEKAPKKVSRKALGLYKGSVPSGIYGSTQAPSNGLYP